MESRMKNIIKYKKLKVNNNIIQDAINIANGVYSPLCGFLREKDFKSVLDSMRLSSGEVWSIPIVIDINKENKNQLENKNNVVLIDDNDNEVAILKNIEIYSYNKNEFARKIFGTEDLSHPGVKATLDMEDYLIGGDVVLIKDEGKIFPDFYLSPEETKEIFKKKGWKTVVAFQTRNVPHRSHEFLQKKALENVDGLLIHPVVGKKKQGDFKDEVILESYQMLLEKYYPKNKSMLSILPIKMRYAGPREAIMHALIRRNYGCTHMIIGRDHAGVGNFYGPYDAQNIFDNFKKRELGIEILKYENVSYCQDCGALRFDNMCNHNKLNLSGTKIREMIKNKENLPEELIRPEISEFLINHPNPFI
jgi:sulfate adenylyltransferase